jgi:hypothetical protein
MSTPVEERSTQEIFAGGVGEITFDVVKPGGAQVPLSALLTLTLTLFDGDTGSVATGPYINSRNAQSILNANGGTVVDNGTITSAILTLSAADNPLITAGKRAEWHIAFFVWTWTGGGPGEKAYAFRVRAKP